MKLQIAVLLSAFCFTGCHKESEGERSEVFRLKNSCSELRAKVEQDANAVTNSDHQLNIYSVFYSKKRNSCLVAEEEMYTSSKMQGQYLAIKDLATQHDVWSEKEEDPKFSWEEILKAKMSEWE